MVWTCARRAVPGAGIWKFDNSFSCCKEKYRTVIQNEKVEALMTAPKPRPGILNINRYVPGDSRIEGVDRVIKLASNENALGASPRAVEAYHQASKTLHLYPDGECTGLREAIGRAYRVDPEKVFCVAGSEQMLRMVPRAYAGPEDEIVFGQYGFLIYRMATHAVGARPVVVEEPDHRIDVDRLLAAVTPRTRIVFVANPGNPTGTYITAQEMARLRSGLPEDVLLVIDSAYADYVEKPDYESGLRFIDEGADNVVVTRTLSKLHGLASLRVGWAYCPPEILDVVIRLRGGFNVSGAAQAAGIAAIEDEEHKRASIAHNARWLAWLSKGIGELGFEVTPSVTNFLLVHFPEGDGGAAAANAFLRRRGIIVRPVAGYGLPNALRITIGLEDENKALLAALSDFANQR